MIWCRFDSRTSWNAGKSPTVMGMGSLGNAGRYSQQYPYIIHFQLLRHSTGKGTPRCLSTSVTDSHPAANNGASKLLVCTKSFSVFLLKRAGQLLWTRLKQTPKPSHKVVRRPYHGLHRSKSTNLAVVTKITSKLVWHLRLAVFLKAFVSMPFRPKHK